MSNASAPVTGLWRQRTEAAQFASPARGLLRVAALLLLILAVLGWPAGTAGAATPAEDVETLAGQVDAVPARWAGAVD